MNATPTTITEIKSLAMSSGSHFFDADTLRFFSSRVSSRVHVGVSGRRVYFVTSEQYDTGYVRKYTVRKIHVCNGRIDTVGEFQAYRTSAQAHGAASRAASADTLSDF